MKAAESLRRAMRREGLDYAGPIVADGRVHRLRAEGDKGCNSWYVLHPGPPAAGCFGCWKRGFKEDWHEKPQRDFTDSEWKNIRKSWKRAEAERERAEQERHTKAQKTAAWILRRAKSVTAHAYLTAKGVRLHGELRQWRDALVLPLRDSAGELHSLQFIAPDKRFDGERDKTFLSGGRLTGCFFTVADKPDGALVIAEGFATGASVHEATGLATVAAMNCGNLLAVAQALRAKWPEREIIIAADNDAFTTGKKRKPCNPGVEKASETARAVGARLAVPKFKDVSSEPTDFNDLARLEGLSEVKLQVEAAANVKETDDEAIARLAAMPRLEYERCRGTEAEKLRIKRTSTLDKLVEARRAKKADRGLQGSAVDLPDVEPWSEPVDGAEVLSEVAETFGRYVVLPDGAADALALFAAHTHCFGLFQCSPRLNVTSPDKCCGKTTLRDVLALLVPRPLPTENLSVAVLFRVIEAHKPTVLADECDAWLRDNEELRGLLNAGHRRGGQALRCEGEGNEVRAFKVFAPAVLCGIGSLPGTLHDRSIVIRLQRAKPSELSARFDSRHTEREHALCRKLARWCADNRERLESCDPTLPSNAFNRLADNWRPLFAVAEVAGGDWPQRAAAAFAKLTSQEDADAQGVGVMLLADVQQAFRDTGAERMFSKTLVDALCAMRDRPWPDAHRGKPITENWLARRLRSFGISPRTIRIGDDRAKGYDVADFTEAFERYLSGEGQSKRDSVTSAERTGGPPTFLSVTTAHAVTEAEAHETSANIGLSQCHGSDPPPQESERELLLRI